MVIWTRIMIINRIVGYHIFHAVTLWRAEWWWHGQNWYSDMIEPGGQVDLPSFSLPTQHHNDARKKTWVPPAVALEKSIRIHHCPSKNHTGWWFQTFGLFSIHIWDVILPIWRTHIYQRGDSTTNQIYFLGPLNVHFIELDDGKIYRNPLYLMVKTIDHWIGSGGT